jgi:hypothetical protein
VIDERPLDPAPAAGPHEEADAGPPPQPPRELTPPSAELWEFQAEDTTWVAWVSGRGAYGTGSYGLGLVEAVHFAHADQPERPLREALIARGRFNGLFTEELRVLLAAATPITRAADRL